MRDCEVCIGGNRGFDIGDYEQSVERSKCDFECSECERPFQFGTVHELTTGYNDDDGEPVRYTACMDCRHIALGLSCNGDRVHGTLWEDLEEDAGFEGFSEACVAKVQTVSAKRYLVERWKKWKGLA